MKKLVLLIVVLVGAWIGLNYMQTGEFSLFPSKMSEEERKIQALEEELASVRAQISQAGRAAGMTGMDTTGDVSALIERQEQLEEEIAKARKALE
jgi:hypothetical protein